MARVKMHTLYAGPSGVINAGCIGEVTEKEARDLVQGRYAEYVPSRRAENAMMMPQSNVSLPPEFTRQPLDTEALAQQATEAQQAAEKLRDAVKAAQEIADRAKEDMEKAKSSADQSAKQSAGAALADAKKVLKKAETELMKSEDDAAKAKAALETSLA